MVRTRVLIVLSSALLAAAAGSGGGCATVEGAGRDLQAVGKGTSDAARHVGDSLTGKK